MKTNIMVLAAGRIASEGHEAGYPTCLTEINGVSILERIIRGTEGIHESHYAFAILDEDARRFHLDKVASLLAPGCKVVLSPETTQGSACTALLVASQLDSEDELLIISANELVEVDLASVLGDFRARSLDGGTITFRSVHPRYSYVRLNAEGLVTEAAQQRPISQHATTGIFWFKRTGAFVEAAKGIIRKNASVSGKFYVAPTYNELILKQARIGVHEIDIGKYKPLKTERQVHQFEQGASA